MTYNSARYKSRRRLQVLIRSIFDDTIWLAKEIGLSSMPGTESLDLSKLRTFSGSIWIFLLFHAAWASPKGTILRAAKWYPIQAMARDVLEKRYQAAAGFPEGSKAAVDSFAKRDKAVRDYKRSLSKSERDNNWLLAERDVAANAKKLFAEGHFVSIIPLDPFTASATLLELMSSGEAERIHSSESHFEPPSDLTPREQNILEALGSKTLQAKELANSAGYPNNSNFRTTLSNLVKRRHLKKCHDGYLQPSHDAPSDMP